MNGIAWPWYCLVAQIYRAAQRLAKVPSLSSLSRTSKIQVTNPLHHSRRSPCNPTISGGHFTWTTRLYPPWWNWLHAGRNRQQRVEEKPSARVGWFEMAKRKSIVGGKGEKLGTPKFHSRLTFVLLGAHDGRLSLFGACELAAGLLDVAGKSVRFSKLKLGGGGRISVQTSRGYGRGLGERHTVFFFFCTPESSQPSLTLNLCEGVVACEYAR